MTWYIVDQQPSKTGHEYRVFFCDEKITEDHLATIRASGVTGVHLRGRATAGRSPDRLAFLGDLLDVTYYELWDIGAARLPQSVLVRLEVLKLAGRCQITVNPSEMPNLWFFAGRIDSLREGRFGSELRWLSVDHWSGMALRSLPFGSGIEYLRVECEGQTVSFHDAEAPHLEKLELHNAEIETLAGIEGAPHLKTLSLQPPGDGPSSLREIDLRPLVALRDLQWLRVGRQGRLVHLEAVAEHKQLQQVHGYKSFFPSEYLDAVWADPMPDSKSVKHLLHGGR